MEAKRRCGSNIATCGNLLVCQPTTVGKCKLEFIAIVELFFRAQTWLNLRNFNLPDAYQLVVNLRSLKTELLLVWKILPLTTATDAKMLTYRLTTQL